MSTERHNRWPILATLSAFATFGAFWGAWGASIPRVRDQVGATDSELGIALLCVGAGALPSMVLTGRVLDRAGLRVAALPIVAMGVAGLVAVLAAQNVWALGLALLVVGATSGATDVAMNSVAGHVEHALGRPIITKAHGALSACVVLAGLLAAALAHLGAPVAAPFVLVAALGALSTAALAMTLRTFPHAPANDGAHGGSNPFALGAVAALGVLGALGFAAEGSHQNWSALFARDVLAADHGRAALAPVVFATVVSITRFAISSLDPAHARRVLLVGSLAASVGAGAIALAPSGPVFVAGLALAAAGTAVLFPTVLGMVSRSVAASHRGRATSLVTTVSYLGFLLAPAYVGALAGVFDLRVAMGGVAALTVVMAVLIAPLARERGAPTTP